MKLITGTCMYRSILVSDLGQWTATLNLKPQDSFGEFNHFFSWSSESAGNHQKTPSDLPAIVLNDIL